MRQVVLDTETTGLDPAVDRIVEIGCVEIVDRKIGNSWHSFVRPPIRVHPEAFAIHGLSDEFLLDKPAFVEIEEAFLEFLRGTDEILIHNAPFDVRFLNIELSPPHGGPPGAFQRIWKIVDTLEMARQIRAGRRNNLNTLAEFYQIENKRDGQHSALVDAEMLARIYLAMTSGQLKMSISEVASRPILADRSLLALPERREIRVFLTEEERLVHAEFCKARGITVF